MLANESTHNIPKRSTHQYRWSPIQDYNISFSGTELERVKAFQKQLEKETLERLPEFQAILNSFFGVDENFGVSTRPSVNITDTVGGGSGRWNPGSNSVDLPLQLSLPYHLGEVENLEDTPHWTTFGHELAHELLIALLTNSNVDEYSYTHRRTSRVVQEFFARLGERATCQAMSIDMPLARLKDFQDTDPHRVFVLADQLFDEISKKTPDERKAMLTNLSQLQQLVTEYEEVFQKANQEVWAERRKRI